MRKYSAIFALILTLWGVFSPLGISIVTNIANRTNTEQKSVAVKIEKQKAFATGYNVPIQGSSPSDNTTNPLDSYNNQSDQPPAETPESIQAKGGNIECGLTDIFCGLFKLIITFILFIPNAVTTVTGLLMDFSIWLGIHPVMYGASGLTVPVVGDVGAIITSTLRDAWGIVRDFSNILFIFALFVIAFSLILNKDLMNFEPKKAIVKVILMALLVNFSFLFCRLTIQTADIFSNLLYAKVKNVDKGGSADSPGIGSLSASSFFAGGLGIASPSLSLVDKVNPQSLLSTAGGFESDGAVGYIRSFGGLRDVKGWEFYVAYGTIAFFVWLMNFILTFVFCSIIFIFLGRIFGLWLAIILSPLAFVSYTIPSLEDNKYFGFKNWTSNLFQLAFMAPVFMFFLYIAVVVINLNKTLETTIGGGGVVAAVMKGMVPLFGAAFILLKGKKIAYDMSGEIGTFVSKYAGMAGSLALGAATGGAGFVGRQTLGRAGTAVANRYAGDNSAVGRRMRTMGAGLGTASFDVRNSPQIMKRFGQFSTAAGENIDLGKRGMREGGFAAEGTIGEQIRKRQERIAKEQEEKLKAEAAAALLNAQAKDAQELRENESKLALAKSAKEAEEAKIAMEAENQGPEKFLEKQNGKLAEKENDKDKLVDEMDKLDDKTLVISLERATIETNQATLLTENSDLETQLTNLNADKAALETQLAAIPNDGSVMSREEKARITGEIATKDTEIQTKQTKLAANTAALDAGKKDIVKKDKEMDDHMKVIEKKGVELEKAEEEITKISSAGTILANVTSVRDARQKRKDFELEAEHSLEKAAMDKEKKDMEEKNTKREEEQKKLSALVKKKEEAEKSNNKAKAAEIQLEIDEQTKERDKKDKDYNEAKAKHKKAKASYDKEFGTKIKTLEDFEKDALKIYDEDPNVIKRRKDATDSVISAQKAVNASKNNIDNINYEFQQKYAEHVENNNPSGGWRESVGTVTGGALFGGSVRDAAEKAATTVRTNITGK